MGDVAGCVCLTRSLETSLEDCIRGGAVVFCQGSGSQEGNASFQGLRGEKGIRSGKGGSFDGKSGVQGVGDANRKDSF